MLSWHTAEQLRHRWPHKQGQRSLGTQEALAVVTHSPTNKRLLLVSIVSHGHVEQTQVLMEQLTRHSAASIARIVITHNIPEPALQPPANGWPFEVQTIWNSTPRGFSANHNQAMKNASEPFVCVLNPDVQLLASSQDTGCPTDPFASLLSTAASSGVGCAYPIQVDAQGQIQDSEREIPTPAALYRRRILHQPQRRIDWVNAACIVLPLSAWQTIQGFDESYFMYCEDVDLCLRVRLAGWQLQRAQATIIHSGQRTSHRQWRHFVWHVCSLLKLWHSQVYKQFIKHSLTSR